MKFLILFFITVSCSTSNSHKPDFWWILENYNSSWGSKQIISMLGKPGEVYQINGEDNWIYTSSKTNNQNWAIGISKEKKVTGLAYIPDEELYIMDIEDRWKSKKCEHKKETKLTASHNYQTIRTFICDNGNIEVFYSRFNEVQRIYLK